MTEGKMYYANLSDEQIEEKISRLTPQQMKKFDEAMIKGNARRAALFVASSWPIEMEGKHGI